jgi:hypothetical protein
MMPQASGLSITSTCSSVIVRNHSLLMHRCDSQVEVDLLWGGASSSSNDPRSFSLWMPSIGQRALLGSTADTVLCLTCGGKNSMQHGCQHGRSLRPALADVIADIDEGSSDCASYLAGLLDQAAGAQRPSAGAAIKDRQGVSFTKIPLDTCHPAVQRRCQTGRFAA